MPGVPQSDTPLHNDLFLCTQPLTAVPISIILCPDTTKHFWESVVTYLNVFPNIHIVFDLFDVKQHYC